MARRFRHFGRHPDAWSRYVYLRELRHREVTFGQNPRFGDWRTMYRLSRPALGRLTGRAPEELDRLFAELDPLHAELDRALRAELAAGALMQAPLLYVLLRALEPRRVVETGVSAGFSARLMLEALRRNGRGRLVSVGLDRIALRPGAFASGTGAAERPAGWLVPDALRGPWSLRLGSSETLLPEVLAEEPGTLDVFLHDSLHLFETMTWEYAQAWAHLAPGGLLLSHDIHNNAAWPTFLRAHDLVADEELDHDLGAVRLPGGARPGERSRGAA